MNSTTFHGFLYDLISDFTSLGMVVERLESSLNPPKFRGVAFTCIWVQHTEPNHRLWLETLIWLGPSLGHKPDALLFKCICILHVYLL